MKKNFVFFGTPHFAVTTLEALILSGRKPTLVITQPDKPSGRGRQLFSPAVKNFCLEKNIPFLQPTKIKTDPKLFQTLKECHVDLFIVVAYGRILPEQILNLPKYTLNVHASLLPKLRGAAPIQRAIINGETSTGISIIQLVPQLDAGDILLQKETDLGQDETSGELFERLAVLGAQTLIQTLDMIDAGQEKMIRQNENEVTFAPPLKVEEGCLDFSMPAKRVHNLIRGFSPSPGAYTFQDEKRLKIFRSSIVRSPPAPLEPPGKVLINQKKLFVATKDSWVEILELQLEGKQKIRAVDYISGYKNKNIVWEKKIKK